MCIMNSSTPIPRNEHFFSLFRKRSCKRYNNFRVRRLNRLRRGVGVEKMEIKNLKLYVENQSIREENERLRRKALLLQHENQTLMAQLQGKKLLCDVLTNC